MRRLMLVGAVSAAVLAGCASMGNGPSAQLSDCLQPNRRVDVEVAGLTPPPKPKVPTKKKLKPKLVQMKAYVQGNSDFAVGSATLEAGGKADIDKFLGLLHKKHITISSVVLSGHTDRFEAASAAKNLSEQRAKAVRDYMVAKGVNPKLIFWEGRGDKDPMAVTKFCQ